MRRFSTVEGAFLAAYHYNVATRPKRELIDVKLPEGFDVNKHVSALTRKIIEEWGPGWEVENINPELWTATASRMVEINEVTERGKNSDTIEVKLTRNTKPSDGDKFAAKSESQHEGYFLTEFEPFLGYAILTKLTPNAARARGAIAVALGVKPWDVQITETRVGGYEFTLPRNYVPSKHFDKLQEVAEAVVGQDGWYVTVNAQKLRAEIIPSAPPTFPPAIPYPFAKQKGSPKDLDWVLRVPLGVTLGYGENPGDTLYLDLDATPGGLVAGTAGSGKSVGINAFVYGVLARGAELVIADLPHKSIDFTWAMPFCRPGGFGCASTAASLTSLAMVYEEGEKRAKLLRKHNVQKWQDLPAAVRPPLIVVVVDEVTGLFGLEEVPRGLPKDHPLVTEAMQQNLETQILKKTIAKIPAEMRFVGIRIVLATQMAQANTGVSVPLKTNLANRILFGSNPNDAARGHALLDPRSAPKVPDNIKADSKASRGVGVAELEGQEPVIFKSFFATTDEYARNLNALGVPTTSRPEPTAAEIAKYTPSLDDGSDEPPSRMRDEVGGFKDKPQPPREDGLTGAAAAGHDSKVEHDAFANSQEAVA